VYIYEDRGRAYVGNCQCGSDEAVRSSDNFVAWADVERPEGQLKRRCPRIYSNCVLRLPKRGKLFLEETYFTSQYKIRLLYYSGRRLVNFPFDRAELSSKI